MSLSAPGEEPRSATHEARRCAIINLSIIVSNECKALITVCAMVRAISLWLAVVRGRYAGRTGIVETKMLSKAYLETARTILRAAQTMTDQHVAGQLRALAEDYERRAEKAANADAAKALARSAAPECEALS
jgi:hypothetical protein